MTKHTLIIIGFITFSSILLAQGIGFPDSPSQAPIGGLELLIGAGGAMAWKKLKNRKK